MIPLQAESLAHTKSEYWLHVQPHTHIHKVYSLFDIYIRMQPKQACQMHSSRSPSPHTQCVAAPAPPHQSRPTLSLSCPFDICLDIASAIIVAIV